MSEADDLIAFWRRNRQRIERNCFLRGLVLGIFCCVLAFALVGCASIGKRVEKSATAIDAVVAYMALAAPEGSEEPLKVFYRQFTLKGFGKVRAEAWTVYQSDGILYAVDGFKLEGHFTIYEGRPFAWKIPDR